MRAQILGLCYGLVVAQLFFVQSVFARDRMAEPASHSITATLKALYLNARFEEAYQLGKQHLLAMEGEQQFDFYFGLVALQSGRPAEALFTFERLVTLYPHEPRFRLEYARALFHMENYNQAETQFRRVLKADPPDRVKENIDQFLRVIERRRKAANKSWSGHVSLGGGYDDNINNATDERFFGMFELPDSAMATSSAFELASLGLAYRHRISQQSSFDISLDTRHTRNKKLSDYDLDVGNLSLSWRRTAGPSEWSPSLTYQHVLLDGDEYQRRVGLAGQWQRAWSQHLLTVFYAGIFQRDSFVNPLLDHYQPLVSFTTVLPRNRVQHMLSAAAGSENPRNSEGRSLAKEFASLRYRVDVKATPTLTPFAEVSGFFADYKAAPPMNADPREDRSVRVSTGLNWQFHRQLSLSVNTAYTDNDSNITLYEYSRWKHEVQALWRF